jgi:hypothetical protein
MEDWLDKFAAADMRFLGLGVQYYVAARSAALAGLLPVCGNLFHHAIEALLKARLSQKHPLPQLKQKFGHELPRLWDAFKAEFPGAGLENFDSAIADVEHFERLRYPDRVIVEGAAMIVRAFITPPESNSVPRYQLNLPVMDELVAKIFEVSSRNPLFHSCRMNPYAREALTRDNSFGDRW